MPFKNGIDYTQFYAAINKPVLTGFSIDKKTGDVSAVFNNTVNIPLNSDRFTRLQVEAILNMTNEKPEHITRGVYQKILRARSKFRRKLSTFKMIYNGKPFDRIIFSGPCTILTGDHNDKTIVRCRDVDEWDAEKAVLAALFIREYGKSQFNILMAYVNQIEDVNIRKEECDLQKRFDSFPSRLNALAEENNESSRD